MHHYNRQVGLALNAESRQFSKKGNSTVGLQPGTRTIIAQLRRGANSSINLDLNMMAMYNSEERRLDDFIRLGKVAGLKFEKLWHFGDMGAVEYRLPA